MTVDDRSSELIDLTPGRTSGAVWVQSDLQLGRPALAREVLANAVADMEALDEPVDAIWCLGDALVGSREADLAEVAAACIELLESFDVPICYVMGNHEMDLRCTGTRCYPLYEQVAGRPLWHTMAKLEDPWFERQCLGCRAVFFGDHADPAGQWLTQHHGLKPTDATYPHTAAWPRLRDRLARAAEPVVFAGHYAFPGGQRPSDLMGQLLPLPETVRLHLHGHAHIGDMVHNREHPWRRNNPITGQPQRQYNISALETARSPGSHSALLRFDAGEPARLDIRCHLQQQWVERFELTGRPASTGS
ncbi:MAG: metallophosphoesterase family protein [Phycisphaeraceae bacterium]